jgi:hypothetical protein
VARCYQRVRLCQDTPEDVSVVDAAKKVVPDHQLPEIPLLAEKLGGGSLSNEISRTLAAPGGISRASEILSELLCVLEKNDITAKSECTSESFRCGLTWGECEIGNIEDFVRVSCLVSVLSVLFRSSGSSVV